MEADECEILVVDDIEDNRYTLERRLKRDGYQNVTLVDGGAAALNSINEQQFDLVLLDLMMPEISGLDVLKTLKADPLNRNIPVIMVTAADEVETAAECISIGADDFISKPFNATLLRARVAASLEKKKLRDQEAIYLNRIEKDKRKSGDLVRAFLPKSAASEIKSLGRVKPRRYEDVGILICDLVGFTEFCESNTPEDVVTELEQVFGLFERIFEDHSVEKLKTVGDAIVGASGISEESDEPVYDIARCAMKLQELALSREIKWDLHLGIHFGPIVAGVIGKKTMQFDFLGKTVNTAFNICDLSFGNDVLISNEAWMRSRNDIKVKSIGAKKLKGGQSLEIFKCLDVV